MYKHIILTKGQADAITEQAKEHDFGVNKIRPIEIANGDFCLSFDVITSGEFKQIREILTLNVNIKNANQIEFVEWDGDGNRLN